MSLISFINKRNRCRSEDADYNTRQEKANNKNNEANAHSALTSIADTESEQIMVASRTTTNHFT
jgi:hypothetical protein